MTTIDEEPTHVDRYCANDLMVSEDNRHEGSRCVEFLDMRTRKRAHRITKELCEAYPEFGDIKKTKFRLLPLAILAEWGAMKDGDVKARALEMIIEAIRTNKSPVTGKPYDDKHFVRTTEWEEIRRMASGRPPAGIIIREVRTYPTDRKMLAWVFKDAIAKARRSESADTIARLEYYSNRLVSEE